MKENCHHFCVNIVGDLTQMRVAYVIMKRNTQEQSRSSVQNVALAIAVVTILNVI